MRVSASYTGFGFKGLWVREARDFQGFWRATQAWDLKGFGRGRLGILRVSASYTGLGFKGLWAREERLWVLKGFGEGTQAWDLAGFGEGTDRGLGFKEGTEAWDLKRVFG